MLPAGPDGLTRSSADAEFGPAAAYRRNKKKEPRRHTLANGIDYNMVSSPIWEGRIATVAQILFRDQRLGGQVPDFYLALSSNLQEFQLVPEFCRVFPKSIVLIAILCSKGDRQLVKKGNNWFVETTAF